MSEEICAKLLTVPNFSSLYVVVFQPYIEVEAYAEHLRV